ncbi:unnamed protein product [Acanthoscelides obtectus]|uniref:Uncharacterized protein n=1 Tax=Acanthoscelides obtectus TaxID=200917 RepID=A0A9P0K770_ACAOB|nr:unnamed protein product [Acanthoscelides obtectus]CAK1673423.1 hypothetical protein AOBTE_LOCUS29333 [Acanthoscelides obtectus]
MKITGFQVSSSVLTCGSDMKIKTSCKLCEITLDQQKYAGLRCTHSPFFPPPLLHPATFGMHQGTTAGSYVQLPQIRDMMLAAYLLRGEVIL